MVMACQVFYWLLRLFIVVHANDLRGLFSFFVVVASWVTSDMAGYVA